MLLVITIEPKRLRALIVAEQKLAALEGGGVDNWEWYGDSLEEHGYFTFSDEFDEVSDRNLAEHI